ncbi:nuclear pore complex protein Nup88 [Cylas formicarius]|uniref:nuclear pore complex protein Nup88 n=1 Tax=Cylas formicarius TaxID=197179 RepID=UPI002958AD1D|nr:nuclear pore complex protein Nup88 [Cylas formicarius]
MSLTDYLRLGECKIFKEACEGLPRNISRTLELVAVRDGVLFTWDFQNNCVLALNIKAARGKDGDNVIHQKLLPLHPPLFTPERILANETGTMLVVAGPNGVLVLQLPRRFPPHGAFDHNKEVVYCRSFSLDERLLACNDVITVRQVRFHPGSVTDSHVLVLTSDNVLRLYELDGEQALSVAQYSVGDRPSSMFPSTKTTFLDIYGEVAVDFDFGSPEVVSKPLWENFREMKIAERDKTNVRVILDTPDRKITPKKAETIDNDVQRDGKQLTWPVYVLRGDYSVYSINVDLHKGSKARLKGPYPTWSLPDLDEDACAMICLNATPQIFCFASSTGTLVHAILLDLEEADIFEESRVQGKAIVTEAADKELLVFETVVLELGLATSLDDDYEKYKCPIHLHKDESKVSRFFATHSAGVHSVNLSCVGELHSFVFGPEDAEPSADIFAQSSFSEYMVCTKTVNSTKSNPVIGFALYYEPTSVITLLADGSVVTLAILAAPLMPKDEIAPGNVVEATSPLKKMLNEPFDQYIQKVLKKSSSQPVLKLPAATENTPEECYELLQRASQVFREQLFKQHSKAREEMEKRIHTLKMLREAQKKEIERMVVQRDELQKSAGDLAEKYEDIKDKQDELLKRCEQLLMLASRKRDQASDAETKFIADLNAFSEKCADYKVAIDKLRNKSKYQDVQIENWRAREIKKASAISEMQANTIKSSLQDSTKKINQMIDEIKEHKKFMKIK